MTHDPSEPLGETEADWRTLCERITREGGACDLTAYGDISAAMTKMLCDALISTSAEVGVIDARGVRFPEGLDLSRLRKCKGLYLSGARIEADFTLGDPRRWARDDEHEMITHPGKGVVVGSAGIDLHRADINGNVVLAVEQVGGGINMAFLKVCGQVSIQGVAPIRFDFSAIGRKTLDRPTKLPRIRGDISLAEVEISGSLSIRDATIDGALGYDRLISRSADESLCKLGALNLHWVEVIGEIDLASLASDDSIELDGVNCAGICFDKASVAASVRVIKCYMNRLPMTGAIFSATNAHVEGDLELTGGLVGRITLDSSKISGHINISQFKLLDSVLMRKLRVDGGLAIIDVGSDPEGDSYGHITLTDCETVGDVEIRNFDRAGLQLSGSFDSITLDALSLSFIRLADLTVKRDFLITGLSLDVPRDSTDANSEGPGRGNFESPRTDASASATRIA